LLNDDFLKETQRIIPAKVNQKEVRIKQKNYKIFLLIDFPHGNVFVEKLFTDIVESEAWQTLNSDCTLKFLKKKWFGKYFINTIFNKNLIKKIDL
jgi:hypothetical protein